MSISVLKGTVFSVLLLCHMQVVVTSYKCLQCDDVPLPSLCDKVGECGQHELCSIEQYVTAAGSLSYRQVCKDKQKCGTVQPAFGKRDDFLSCSECCQGDLCNAAGCGQKGFDPVYGPLCYVCPLQLGSGSCGKIQQCGRDKVCSIQPVSRVGAPDNLFETKCIEKNDRMCGANDEIDSSMIIGRKRSTCSVCCNSTMCNDYDSRPCLPSSTTATTISMTSPVVSTMTSIVSSPSTKLSSVTKTSTAPTTETITRHTVTTAHGFTTAPVTPEVCEDLAKCYDNACTISNPTYIAKNCRKTCKLCGTLPATLATTTPKPTSTPMITTTSSSSTISSTSYKTTTSNSGNTGHTHGLYCHDIAEGCDTFVHFCTLNAYKDWSKDNCRKTCNYC